MSEKYAETDTNVIIPRAKTRKPRIEIPNKEFIQINIQTHSWQELAEWTGMSVLGVRTKSKGLAKCGVNVQIHPDKPRGRPGLSSLSDFDISELNAVCQQTRIALENGDNVIV